MATLDCITVDSVEITVDVENVTVDVACCPAAGSLVEVEIDRVLTQYRESPKLLGLIRAYLGQVETIAIQACAMFDYFDLDTAVGDQLTIIGKIFGFPRCHCVCVQAPVIGYGSREPEAFTYGGEAFTYGGEAFTYGSSRTYTGPYTLAGYCEPGSSWVHCAPLGNGEICITDDETYRDFLKARRYQMLGLYDVESLLAAARHIWGPTAELANAQVGQIVLSPGRALTTLENDMLPIAFRVLPIAPGIKGMVNLGLGTIAGYGEGWGGYCEDAVILCPTDPHTYTCA